MQKKLHILRYILPLILVLIFFSLTGRSFRRAPWYEQVFSNLVGPPQRVFSAISSGIEGAWEKYFALVRLREEYDALKTRLSELELQRVEMEEVKKENERLRGIISFGERLQRKIIAARVIANDPRAEFKSVTINRGTDDGVMPLSPVVGPRGLVGKVGKTSKRTSLVILVTDPNSAVDAMVERSRTRGMAVGAAAHTELKAGHYLTRLEYLERTSDVRDGDVVITSGLDGVFPGGISIGTVQELKLSRYGIFKEAIIVPFENMAELQEVGVVQGGGE